MGKNLSIIFISVCIIISAILLTLTYLTKQGKIENPITQIQNSLNNNKNPVDNFKGKIAEDKFGELKKDTEEKTYLYSLLVLGNDKRYELEPTFRTDTIMVITVNKKIKCCFGWSASWRRGKCVKLKN